MCEYTFMRKLPTVVLVVAVVLAGCWRGSEADKKGVPSKKPAAVQTAPAPPERGLAEYDLTGRARAKPRPTMGALEADPATPAPKPPAKKEKRQKKD